MAYLYYRKISTEFSLINTPALISARPLRFQVKHYKLPPPLPAPRAPSTVQILKTKVKFHLQKVTIGVFESSQILP